MSLNAGMNDKDVEFKLRDGDTHSANQLVTLSNDSRFVTSYTRTTPWAPL